MMYFMDITDFINRNRYIVYSRVLINCRLDLKYIHTAIFYEEGTKGKNRSTIFLSFSDHDHGQYIS
jgi:hypothetical protein